MATLLAGFWLLLKRRLLDLTFFGGAFFFLIELIPKHFGSSVHDQVLRVWIEDQLFLGSAKSKKVSRGVSCAN